MSAPNARFTSLLSLFSELDVNPVDFIIVLLEDNTYQSHPVARSTLEDIPYLIDALFEQVNTKEVAIDRAVQAVTATYTEELTRLTRPEAGFHFGANRITESRLEDANLMDMAVKMGSMAPNLSLLLEHLLSADKALEYQRKWQRKKSRASSKPLKLCDGDIDMHDIEGFDSEAEGGSGKSTIESRESTLFAMVSNIVLSCRM